MASQRDSVKLTLLLTVSEVRSMRFPKEPDDPTGIVLLRVREIRERLAVSVSYLYDLIGADLFPRFVPLGVRSSGLPEHVLDAWLWQCLQLRDAMQTLVDPVKLPAWPPAVVVPSPVHGIRMLRLGTVVRRVGLSPSHIYRLIAAGVFPRPVPLGPRVRRWADHEIRDWTASRLKFLTGLQRKDRDWYLRPPARDDDDDDDDPDPEAPA